MSKGVFKNPVLPGFYPDPSICLVGDTYYLANSTFEYFPGIPVHKSTDLIHWELAGHVIHREGQLDLSKAHAFGGIWAPTIRFHDGLFYMVCNNTGGVGNFVATATDVAGPWSDLAYFTEKGFDSSIFFEEGRTLITMHEGGEHGRIIQAEYDLDSKKIKGDWVEIWRGLGGVWPEGPHLIKKDGWYYLQIAEGGTSYGHRIHMARSRDAFGPFEPSPSNPLICHEGLPDHPVQATGHGDLFQAKDGSWWLVYLAIRPKGGQFHHLGRETFLAPVDWPEGGWPVLTASSNGELELPAADWMESAEPDFSFEDDFTSPALSGHWNFLRNPDLSRFQSGEGKLRIKGGPESIEEVASPSWMGIRQRHFDCEFTTRMDFEPAGEKDEAGINVHMNEEYQAGLSLVLRGGGKKLRAWLRVEGKAVEEKLLDAPPGPLDFKIRAEAEKITLACGGSDCLEFAPQPLATEKAGGFTGLYFALYVHSASATTAEFQHVRYNPA